MLKVTGLKLSQKLPNHQSIKKKQVSSFQIKLRMVESEIYQIAPSVTNYSHEVKLQRAVEFKSIYGLYTDSISVQLSKVTLTLPSVLNNQVKGEEIDEITDEGDAGFIFIKNMRPTILQGATGWGAWWMDWAWLHAFIKKNKTLRRKYRRSKIVDAQSSDFL